LGVGSGSATGIAFVASANNFFINYSPWVPGWGGSNTDVKPSGFANYLRAAYLMDIAGWDSGFGFQSWSGDATVADSTGSETNIVTDAWVIDAQAQGSVRDMLLGLYASYGKCGADATHFAGNCQNNSDADAFAILAKLGVIPTETSVYLAYRTMDSGATTAEQFDSWTLGVTHLYAQNIRFDLFTVQESGSGVDARASQQDAQWMLQLFAGF
jgi:hypothetical protein